MIVGIDQSKRSTAAVCIGLDGKLIDFIIIASKQDNEALVAEQWGELDFFLCKKPIRGIALEGLSFNSKGSGKDLLAGIFWYFRTRLYLEYGNVPVGVIPVTAWRSKVISAAERKVVASYKVKDGIKKYTVEKLPFEVKVMFEQYVREQSLKKEAIYDLADAYFIAQYRLSLEEA